MGRLGRFTVRGNDLFVEINDFYLKIQLLPHLKEIEEYAIPAEMPEIVNNAVLTLIAPNENTLAQAFFENYEAAISFVEEYLIQCKTVEEVKNALLLYNLRVDNTSGKGRVS
jgi:hypothetical protein